MAVALCGVMLCIRGVVAAVLAYYYVRRLRLELSGEGLVSAIESGRYDGLFELRYLRWLAARSLLCGIGAVLVGWCALTGRPAPLIRLDFQEILHRLLGPYTESLPGVGYFVLGVFMAGVIFRFSARVGGELLGAWAVYFLARSGLRPRSYGLYECISYLTPMVGSFVVIIFIVWITGAVGLDRWVLYDAVVVGFVWAVAMWVFEVICLIFFPSRPNYFKRYEFVG